MDSNPLAPPAIANAVYQAVGARVCTLPVTAERIRTARQAADARSDAADDLNAAHAHGDAREVLSAAHPSVEFEAGLPEWSEGRA